MNAPASQTLEIPTIPGTPFGGGYYVGRFFIGAQAYALIVSPKSEETELAGPWNKSLKRVAEASSYNDGLANTEAMAKAGSAIAKAFRALTIGDSNDWYLPSRLEALLLFAELREAPGFETDAVQALERDWYWTSTQYAGSDDYAWIQSFYYGSQLTTHKDYDLRARAVRRLKI